MKELEQLLALFVAAVILAAVARRVESTSIRFSSVRSFRGAPPFTVAPELALALFVAPALLDAAYDASPRDLRKPRAPPHLNPSRSLCRRPGNPISLCAPTTRSATMSFIGWELDWLEMTGLTNADQ